jgi:tetratricopeptide (TPR) repeat protein
MEELIVEGKTTVAELEQILGKPSFYVTPEPPETGKYWVFISWRGRIDSPNKFKTTRKALVRHGIVVKYSSKTVLQLEGEGIDTVELLRHGCLAFAKKGRYDQSIACLNEDIDLNPRNAGAYNHRGIAYAKGKGQYDKAIGDFSKAIELNPRYAAAYYNRGLAYYNKGQHDKALADYSRAIEINPRDAKAYNNRGIAYFYIKEYDNAWRDVKKAQSLGYKIDPKFLKNLREASGRHE